ncbi:MAG: hypothetical protein HFJ43_01190 [Clostridia bacterium]|nr:hypothetical protein [Clostridia bacterium]
MKLGVTLVNRKISKVFKEDESGSYIFDENGALVAKKTNGLFVQFFVESAGEVCLLVVAKNYKRKLGHDLFVTEVAQLFPADGETMISYKKNRIFVKEADEKAKGEVRIIGMAEDIDGMLRVYLPKLGVDETLTKSFKNNECRNVYIINERVKELKG